MEKRKHSRVEKEFVVIFKNKNSEYFARAKSANISLGGICLQVDPRAGLSADQILKLQFQVEGLNEVIEVKSIVKWLSEIDKMGRMQVGLEFLELNNAELMTLKDKLKKSVED